MASSGFLSPLTLPFLGVHHVSGHLSTMSPVRTVLAGWLGCVSLPT
jgi:tRNA A37 threonylcarbamoyltransferase TsaD